MAYYFVKALFFLSWKISQNNFKRAGKLAQSGKVSAAKPDDLSSTPGKHVVEDGN